MLFPKLVRERGVRTDKEEREKTFRRKKTFTKVICEPLSSALCCKQFEFDSSEFGLLTCEQSAATQQAKCFRFLLLL